MTFAHAGAAPQKRVPKMPRMGMAKTLTAESSTLSIDQLARLSEVSEADIRELMDYGVLVPASSGIEPLGFRTDSAAILRHAGHLRRDLALDIHAFSLAVMFLEKIASLETELGQVRAQLQGGPGAARRSSAPERSLNLFVTEQTGVRQTDNLSARQPPFGESP